MSDERDDSRSHDGEVEETSPSLDGDNEIQGVEALNLDEVFGEGDPELVKAIRERDEFLKALQLLQADFENYKKRVQKQQAESLERANEVLISKLLPVLDTLSLALSHSGESEAATSTVAQIQSALVEVLKKEGLEELSPVGQAFDPATAEAVAHEDGEGGPTVTEVFRSGYLWRGRVLRPAMVKVSG